MRITRDQRIAGYPALEIRDLLRHAYSYMTQEIAAERLQASPAGGAKVIEILVKEGFLEPHEHEKNAWQATIKGNALRMASSGKPISRTTAERLVRELLARIEQVNAPDAPYLCRVKSLQVFGSYTTDTRELGDVDLVLEIERKENNPNAYMKLAQDHTRRAMKKGRRFPNIVEELYWPETEVKLFLRARSAYLNFHEADPIIKQVKLKQLWPRPKP